MPYLTLHELTRTQQTANNESKQFLIGQEIFPEIPEGTNAISKEINQ
jgi:hypothetical protein